MSIEECDQRTFISRCHLPSALTSILAPSTPPNDARERGNSKDQAAAALQLQAEKGAARAPKRAARQGREEGRRAAGVNRQPRRAGEPSPGRTPRPGPEVGEKQREPDEQLSWCS